MRIYLAGYYNGKASAYAIERDAYDWFLESYHYINTRRHCAMIRADKRTIFLDSGAFSAFTQGVEIRLSDYADFVRRNKDILHTVSNLDDLHKNEKKTWENQKALEATLPGTYILPVFHTREDPAWLKKYIDAGYSYIAIGGMVAESNQWLEKWLDDVWDKWLTDDAGHPRVKVHGFGLTTFDLMLKYPWFSVDSTRWVLAGRYGTILLPDDNGRISILNISTQSPRVKDWGAHYDNLSAMHRKKIKKTIESMGFDVEELRTIYWKRDLFNIAAFRRINDMQRELTFKKTARSLFDA